MKYKPFNVSIALNVFNNISKIVNELIDDQEKIRNRWTSSDNSIKNSILLATDIFRMLMEQSKIHEEIVCFKIIEILFTVSYDYLRRIEQIYETDLATGSIPYSKHDLLYLKKININEYSTSFSTNNFIERVIKDFSKIFIDLLDESKTKSIGSNKLELDLIAYAEHRISKEKFHGMNKGVLNEKISEPVRSEYLKHLQKYLDKELFKFGLTSFIDGREAVVASREHWSKNDKEILQLYRNKIQKIELVIDDFLQSSRSEKFLYVAAPFGTGKSTSLLRCAKHYSICYEQNDTTYLPILIFLKNGLESVYGNLDLKETFNLLKVKDEKILLILDGLDEYPHELSNLMKMINKDYDKYKNLKIVFTTRLVPDYPSILEMITYLRILPFTQIQVNTYLKELFQNAKMRNRFQINELTIEDLSSLGLSEEELTKPLLLWMIFQIRDLVWIFINRSRKWHEIDHDNPLTQLKNNEKKTVIYLFFISNINEGKFGRLNKSKNWDIHIKEKQILRKIAFLKNVYQEKLTEDILRRYKLFIGIEGWDIDNYSKLIQTYFILSDDKKYRVVNFLHQTFNEYLLAENYIESIINKNKLSLTTFENYSSISVDTFVNGFLSLLQNTQLKNHLQKHNRKISYILENLIDSFGKSGRRASRIKQIKKNSLELLNCTNLPLEDLNLLSKAKIQNDLLEELLLDNYPLLWNYRWIALYVYLEVTNPNTLERSKIEIDKLKTLLKSNGNKVYYYIKDLRNLNFTKSNLSSCHFINVNLDSCKFVGSNLRGINLWFCNLTNTDFTNADMSGSNLSGFSLRGLFEFNTHSDARFNQAHMEKTELIDSNLTNLHFYGTRFLHTNLSGTNFGFSELDHTLFIKVNLENTNFDRTIIKDCFFISHNFQNSTFQGSYVESTVIISDGNEFDFLVSSETTLNEVYTDNPLLADYLISSGCIGTSLLLSSRQQIEEELRKITHTEVALQELMSYCYYKE